MNRKYLFAAIMSAVFLCAFAAAGFRVLRQNPRYAQKRACREVETMQQEKVLRDGDLIFQTSLSGQSRAIQEPPARNIRTAASSTATVATTSFTKPYSP